MEFFWCRLLCDFKSLVVDNELPTQIVNVYRLKSVFPCVLINPYAVLDDPIKIVFGDARKKMSVAYSLILNFNQVNSCFKVHGKIQPCDLIKHILFFRLKIFFASSLCSGLYSIVAQKF